MEESQRIPAKAVPVLVALAREQLRKEILLAKKERATAPPYRGGDLEW